MGVLKGSIEIFENLEDVKVSGNFFFEDFERLVLYLL